jgi:hemolysin III
MSDYDVHERLEHYAPAEERLNRISHGLGVLLSLLATVMLMLDSVATSDPWRIVSCAVFSASLLIFYLSSTLYHTVQSDRLRYLFRILDHATIFVLIAGSYTPFTLVTLRGPWGWSLFGIVWGLAVAGVVLKVFMTHRLKILGPVIYICMGWLMIVAVNPLLAALPGAGFYWVLAGGIIYTAGVLVYAIKQIPYNHAIWHLFVLTGSFCHVHAVYWYVVPL